MEAVYAGCWFARSLEHPFETSSGGLETVLNLATRQAAPHHPKNRRRLTPVESLRPLSSATVALRSDRWCLFETKFVAKSKIKLVCNRCYSTRNLCTATINNHPHYTQVEEGDGSSRLGYASTTALSAGAGDILRASAHPSTSVDLALPAKGALGSLSWSSEVVVDTSAGYILDVRRASLAGELFLLSTYSLLSLLLMV